MFGRKAASFLEEYQGISSVSRAQTQADKLKMTAIAKSFAVLGIPKISDQDPCKPLVLEFRFDRERPPFSGEPLTLDTLPR